MANADRIIELLHEAKGRPAGAERARFLNEACGQDSALKEQIISLLEADAAEGESDFLKITRIIRPSNLPAEKPGDRIGRYKLLEQIGEGGCGVVYMAEQEEPVRRRVALKVIKLGMDTKQVIARFEAERQALAMMDHPNIAKVLEAGATDTGRPYFVMELVRGIKITDYCDQNKLSTRERLELFIQICQAIQHAHQKGIIHRDIKPSNILVTQHDDVAVPKVIDFGISKATVGQLTDKTVFTAFAQFVGTPAYMSPEQAQMSGLDVDTRADIYSLGVLLYELLTGNTPFDAKELLAAGMDEMRRKIREDEPAKPSTCLSTMTDIDLTAVARRRHVEPPRLVHLIRGDLDWLVMKCLEKDRTRRYETASALATDLQRHLDNEPVVARPPSNLYRFRKFVRRNKLGFAAGASVLLVLLGGIAASTWQAVRATRAEREQARERAKAEANEKKAESEAAKSQQVAQFMKDMLNGVGPSVAMGRDTTMLREIVDKTAERIGKDLKNQPEAEIDLRLTLADVYSHLQLYKKVEETARETLRLARAQFGEENLAVADALGKLGWALKYLRVSDEAESVTRRAIQMHRELRGPESVQEADCLVNLGDVLRRQATVHEDKSRGDESESACRQGLATYRKRLGNDSDEVAWALISLSITLGNNGKWGEVAETREEAVAIFRKRYGEEHPSTAAGYTWLAGAFAQQNKFDEAEAYYRKGLAIQERFEGKGKWHQAAAHEHLANLLRSRGKLVEAEAEYREALATAETGMGESHPDLPRYLTRLAVVLRENGKLAEARALAERSFEFCERSTNGVEVWLRNEATTALQSILTQMGDAAALEKLNLTRESLAKPRPVPPRAATSNESK